MACPFFYPIEAFDQSRWHTRPQMPLGDPYDGECRADAATYRPNDEELRKLCNLGYVRGKCPRFRHAHEVDAVRFTVSREVNDSIIVTYVQERDHRPFEHGKLEYQMGTQSFVSPHPEVNVHQQARAYVAAYLRRRALPAASGGPSRR